MMWHVLYMLKDWNRETVIQWTYVENLFLAFVITRTLLHSDVSQASIKHEHETSIYSTHN